MHFTLLIMSRFDQGLPDDAFDVESTEFVNGKTFVAIFIPLPVIMSYKTLWYYTLLGQVMS